jgi:hypothetical protein
MEIVKKKLNLKIYGNSYEMKFPSYKDSISYEKKLKECGDDSEKKADTLLSYLEQLGLPKEVSEEMPTEDIISVMEHLSGQKKS